jgi:hypothetical protein
MIDGKIGGHVAPILQIRETYFSSESFKERDHLEDKAWRVSNGFLGKLC